MADDRQAGGVAVSAPEADAATPRVLVLGAAGLIGHAAATALRREGCAVTAAARAFAPGQRFDGAIDYVEGPFVGGGSGALAALVERAAPDVVINCIGVLGDAPGVSADAVHHGFVMDCVEALRGRPDTLFVHVSVPGEAAHDGTPFSRTKRAADEALAGSGHPFVILRPGFVFAPSAYGGSALLRMLAASPIALPAAERERPFRTIGMADLAETMVRVVRAWLAQGEPRAAVWDVMCDEPTTLGDVTDALRDWLGTRARVRVPRWALDLGARCGDLAVRLGWRPPVRTAALAELRRGVRGDPRAFMTATGIAPRPLRALLADHPASVQERWFARLFGLKPIILAVLATFWIASGAITFAAYGQAHDILVASGFPAPLAHVVTAITALADVAVGVLIAHRRTCRKGLWAAIGLTLFYLASATVLTPYLWLDPLGVLVKTIPALVLIGVALATLEAR